MTTYVKCPFCGRIIAAYGKNGRTREHRLDTHPDNYGPNGEPYYLWPPNTDCPGSKEFGEIVEGEIYESPVDSLKWHKVQ